MRERIEELVNLIETNKFNELHKDLQNLNFADFPALFDEISIDKIIIIYRLLSKEKAAEVFTELDSDVQEKLINSLTDIELKDVINKLFMDDTVDLIEEMPSNIVKRILKNIKSEDRKVINELLNYPEDSAGSMMTTEFIDLKENMTVDQAFEKIKKIGLQKETVYNCYVLSVDRKLLGIIDIKQLLIAERTELIKNIMETNVMTISTTEDAEEVAKMFHKYYFIAMPVVDKENRLVGIITIDDAMDVMQEEATEDFEKMAAITPSEEGYFKTSVLKQSKNRILWLLILMLSAAITGGIIMHYEEAFKMVPVLVAFIPMIMDTAGNCGAQSSTLIIRGLATDEIKPRDFLKIWWKEIRVAVLVGFGLAIVNGVRVVMQYQELRLAIVLGLTLIFTVIIAKSLGCLLPLVAKKFKIDPAIMAAPLITTIADILAVFVFFNIAILILQM